MNAAASKGTGSVVLDDLAEVIGEAAAFDLAWEFRGVRLYVPKDHTRDPAIAQAIGAELAVKLCHVFGGTTINCPMREAARRQVHHLRHQCQMPHHAIARKLRIAERQVYRLLESPPRGMNADAARPVDDRQLDMF